VTEAILLVGGYGTRLKPLTIHTPKPMLKVAGFPVTQHQISKAKNAGIDHIVLGTAFKAEVFKTYLGDGSFMGVKLDYAYEPVQLGTGGGIRNASQFLTCGPEDPVVIFNGDVLTGVDIKNVLKIWKESNADVALYLTKVKNPKAYGLVPTDNKGNVLAFLEKPEKEEDIVTDQINAGMYVFKRKIIDTIPTEKVVSVEREVFPNLLKNNYKVIGVVDESYWLDLGTPQAFIKGSSDLVTGEIDTGLVKNKSSKLIGENVKINENVEILNGSYVGNNSSIGQNSKLDNCVIGENVLIGKNCVITSSIIASGSKIGDDCKIFDSVIADNVEIGNGSSCKNDSRIWPDQKLEQIHLDKMTIPENPDWQN
jgi:mannose-1-phosphate guanylyltransferase